MKTFLSAIGLILLAALIDVPVYFLYAHVIKDGAQLYDVPMISGMPTAKIIFFLILIGLVFWRDRSKGGDKDPDAGKLAIKAISATMLKVVVALMCWGMFYFIHLFL